MVVGTTPLVVAAYCDEMDAVALLRFPDFLIPRHRLQEGTRLVTTNLQRRGDPLAADLVPGPAYLRRYTNFRPLIADFLAAEEHLVEARRQTIAEAEYQRCWQFAQRAVQNGQPLRSGRPLEAATPAPALNQTVGQAAGLPGRWQASGVPHGP